MKVNKTQAVLYMFNYLKENGYFTKDYIQSVLEINNLTFARYIQELKAFLYNFYFEYEVKYVKADDRYYLIKK